MEKKVNQRIVFKDGTIILMTGALHISDEKGFVIFHTDQGTISANIWDILYFVV